MKCPLWGLLHSLVDFFHIKTFFFILIRKGVFIVKKTKIFSKLALIFLGVLVVVPTLFWFGCKDNLSTKSRELSNYSLTLEFDEKSNILKAEQTVNFKNSYDIPLSTLEFHLYPNAFRQGAKYRPVSTSTYQKAYKNGFSEGKIDVAKVAVDGTEKDVNVGGSDQNMLIVSLGKDLYPDDSVEILLNYSVLLPNCEHRFGYGDNTYNFGNFYPILAVYENGNFREDNYGANGDPFYSEMSNYDVTLTYNSDFVLASSGRQLSTTLNDHKKTTKISAKVVRDFGFVLSRDFVVLSGKANNVDVYYYYYDEQTPEKSLGTAIRAIKTFSDLFGDYPYDTYSVVKADFVHCGMEYPNLVYISDSVQNYDDYQNVIVHETAHQWWYNLVGSDACNDAWQDEGLTEFSTLMFYRYNSGYNVVEADSLSASLSSYLLFCEVYESVYGKIDSSMSRNVNDFAGDMQYTYMTYVKGVLFFDSLEDLIGEKAFLKGLKLYFKQYEYKIATKDDMISCFESVSKKNLKGFFDSWLNGKVVLQGYSSASK